MTGVQQDDTSFLHSELWSGRASLSGDMWRKYWFKRLAEVTSEEEVFKGRKIDLLGQEESSRGLFITRSKH